MRLNGGSAKVVDKNVVLLDEDMFFGQLTAVKHIKGEDWWIFIPAQESTNGYFRFLLTEEGVSEPLYQEVGISGTQPGGWASFSPSSRFMYVSSYDFIYQFDTWANDIAASRITVAEYEYQGVLLEDNFWGMQLGPDCKLYVFCNSCDVIHVIHNPDEPGLACNFEQGAVELPWPIFRSQPHFPNYRLGPVGDEGLPCTLVVSGRDHYSAHM
jgi:hypothetical protein